MCNSKKDVSVAAAVGLVTGLATGYLVGLLTAPKSGAETRQYIVDATNRAVASAQQKLSASQAQVSELVEVAKAKAKSLTMYRRQDLDELIDSAKIAQDKAKAMLIAVKQGEADDPDLQRAVEKANQAKENLANFLKNN